MAPTPKVSPQKSLQKVSKQKIRKNNGKLLKAKMQKLKIRAVGSPREFGSSGD